MDNRQKDYLEGVNTEGASKDLFYPKKRRNRHRKETKAFKRRNYLKKKARKEFRRRKKKERREVRGSNWLVSKNPDQFEIVDVPKIFSLVKNTEEVLNFFKKTGNIFDNCKQIYFNLEEVEELTPDAITLLVAKIKDKNFTRGLGYKGNTPKKEELRRIIEESGFFEHVNSYYITPRSENNFLFHQVTNKKVNPALAAKGF